MTRQSDSATTTALHSHIRTMLRIADATSMAGSLGRFLKGLGVCFGMGVLVASLITAFLLVAVGNTWIGWFGWFLAYMLILVPLLIWHELRSRKGYLTEAIRSADPNTSSRGFTVGMVTSLLVWGPRALIDGFRGLRGLRSPTQEAVFDRAAVLVIALSQASGGVPIKELMIPPENMLVFGSAVDLLDRHWFIGKSTDGRSMWLDSTIRKKLAERRFG